jgi:glycosyltransferase involved in cell wall biosynthesis
MNEICVSIFMLTYNQEDFIAQAIEGVLMQKTDFSIQMVIGEDCSTDNTRNIVREYAQKYPDKIKIILNERNIGLIANYVKTYTQCTGKYVAICDGDDYWIDPLKLQKQVSFLEENPDYAIVYTNNKNLIPSGDIIISDKKENLHTTTFEELVFENYIPSVTVLFRNKQLPEGMSKWIQQFPYGDWPSYLWLTVDGGKIYFLDEVTSVYRKNFGTSTVLREERSKMGEINLLILQNIRNDENFIHRQDLVNKGILKYKKGLMASYNKEKKYLKSIFLMVELCFKTRPFLILKLYAYSLKCSIK